MGRFHEQMNRGRRKLHEFMQRPALCFEHPYRPGDAGKPITVRVHDNYLRLGDLKGTNFNYAEKEEDVPTLIFMRDELAAQGIELKRNMIVSVEPGLGYRISTPKPPNGITISTTASRLDDEDVDGLPVPQNV